MNNGTVYIEFFDVKFVIELGRDANIFSTIKNISYFQILLKANIFNGWLFDPFTFWS